MSEVESRYAITAEWARRKAKLLVDLAGGKAKLQHMHALDAVAMGCGFRDWHELGAFIVRVETEGPEAAGATQQMLADNLHVYEDVLTARMHNQEAAVRKYVKCSPGQTAAIVRKWSLTDYAQKHGARVLAASSSPPEVPDNQPQSPAPAQVTYRKHRTKHAEFAD